MTDFTPAAYFPDDCIITIQEKGSTATNITTDVTNFSDGGGGKDTETIAHFGGAKLVIKKPQEDFEVTFDVDVNDTFWSNVMSGRITTVGSASMVTSDGTQDYHKVKLEWIEPETGSAGLKLIYYNALGISYEKDNAADDYLKATVSFKISPQDDVGSGQRFEIDCSNFSDTNGSGSYNSWETAANTLFGYS